MAKGEEQYKEILNQIEIVKEEGEKFYDKGNKAAGTRFRKALMTISKLNKALRKETFG
jgi:hypothetical protein